jgi:hypothetical protein
MESAGVGNFIQRTDNRLRVSSAAFTEANDALLSSATPASAASHCREIPTKRAFRSIPSRTIHPRRDLNVWTANPVPATMTTIPIVSAIRSSGSENPRRGGNGADFN